MKKDIKKEIGKKNKRLLFLGFFFRYGICITAILVPFIFIIIGDILNKKEFIGIGIFFFILGVAILVIFLISIIEYYNL